MSVLEHAGLCLGLLGKTLSVGHCSRTSALVLTVHSQTFLEAYLARAHARDRDRTGVSWPHDASIRLPSRTQSLPATYIHPVKLNFTQNLSFLSPMCFPRADKLCTGVSSLLKGNPFLLKALCEYPSPGSGVRAAVPTRPQEVQAAAPGGCTQPRP